MAPDFVPLEALPLSTSAERLARFGFTGAYTAGEPYAMASQAAHHALADAALAPESIDLLLYIGALADSHQVRAASRRESVLSRFCYPGSRLQDELGASRAVVSGVAQQGCAGLFSALRSARAVIASEPEVEHVLCVGADALPAGSTREIMYNVISDAGCAAIVSRGPAPFRWLAYHQVTKGYYWNVPQRSNEIIASYFPTARAVILETLRRACLTPDGVDLLIPTGVNDSTWPILLRLCGIPEERLFRPERKFGHTIAADSFLQLAEARAAGALHPGMHVLLFTFGFGSSWCALLLRYEGEGSAR